MPYPHQKDAAMMTYSPISASPSNQFDSPSKTITAPRIAASATPTTGSTMAAAMLNVFLVTAGRSVQQGRERRDDERADGKQRQRGDHAWQPRSEFLWSVAQTADDERQPQHEQTVAKNRADERS